MGGPSTVILVPRRADHGWRDRLWAVARARWRVQFPDMPIFEGHHNVGPFNRAAAINTAAREAGDWDYAIVIDGDIFIDSRQVRAALAKASQTGRVTWAFYRWRGLSEDTTTRILDDPAWVVRTFGEKGFAGWRFHKPRVDMDSLVEVTNPLSWSCCFIIPRAVWDAIGGFDERFRGWGYEDMAFQSVVVGEYGFERVDGDVFHLWHPRSDERQMEGGKHRRPYLENSILGRLYMIAERRLRLEAAREAGDAEAAAFWKQDIANLEFDIGVSARKLGIRPPLERPTLSDLVAGSKAGGPNPYVGRRGPVPTPRKSAVAVIMHTDGRRQYIEKAVESLEANLRLDAADIERKVFYDDSGDAAYRQWLIEKFGMLGWYVVGPPNRRGYTRSMQAMTRYIQQRVGAGYVLQVEDDFTYREPIDVASLRAALEARPDLAQIALLRDAYYPAEKASDGILGWPRSEFKAVKVAGQPLLVHRLFWTCNPNIAPRDVYAKWPSGRSSERRFGDSLLAKGLSFAFAGTGTPAIDHIGAERAGHDY